MIRVRYPSGKQFWLALLAGGVVLAVAAWAGSRLGWTLAGLLLVSLAGWGAAFFFYRASRTQARQARMDQQRQLAAERRAAEDRRRLETLLRLNHGLVETLAESRDERAVMDMALSTLTEMVGALGCSFVPVDEWDQPLPAFTYGQLPEPVLQAWSAHLASGMLSERCRSCHVLESHPGGCPLHPEQVGGSLTVYCIPLLRIHPDPADGSRSGALGVLHLYLPSGRTLDGETRSLLDGMLREIALAYESAHLRAQEMATLRQIQLLHAPESDFSASLGSLLDGLKQALEADCVLVRLRPLADERLSNLSVLRGELCGLDDLDVTAIFERVLEGQALASEPGRLPVWLALPLVLPESAGGENAAPAGRPLGMLLVASDHPHEFHPRQKAILQTVAAQVGLLIENERLLRSLEYKVVIQERTRLAREIHDGLAQTLAFLKLQAAQMQSYLAQGDLSRLAQVLKDNYQALAEAYLDTRQAIDNLRLTPHQGLDAWLDRIIREFEQATGLVVVRALDPEAQVRSRAIPPEVQAQLIRIVQEALSNVRKHARARAVWLSLHEWHGDLVLEVRDDGLGFDAGDLPDVSQHGLRGMRERAELIGADFQIISQALQGTTVRLVLPRLLLTTSLEESQPQ